MTIGRGGVGTYGKEGENFEHNAYADWIRQVFNFEVTPGDNGWLADEGHDQKVTLAISSGNIPDLMLVNQKQLRELVESGMIEELTPYVEQYSSKLLQDIVDSAGGVEKYYQRTIVDGKIWGATGLEPGYQYSVVWIRSDWLKKAALEAPKNLDELLNAARKFKELDLAGNGLTVPIEVQPATSLMVGNYNSPTALDPLFNNMQAFPRTWYKDDSGKYVYGSIQPAVKNALSFMHDLYKEGLLAQDFGTRDHMASLAAGYSGITFGPWWSSGWPLNDTKNNNPAADWIPINCTLSSDGVFYAYKQDPGGSCYVVRKGFEHPEILIKLVNIITEFGNRNSYGEIKSMGYDEVMPDEVWAHYQDVPGMGHGAWPVHLNVQFDESLLIRTEKEIDKYDRFLKGDTTGIKDAETAWMTQVKNYRDGKDAGVESWVQTTQFDGRVITLDLSKNLKMLDNVYPMVTPTMETKWSNLQTLEINAYLKIIRGDEPVDSFDTFVSQWNAQGGNDITAEVNDSLSN